MNTNLAWEAVKKFYKDTFGTDAWVVELYANLDILLLCSSGASNKSITNLLEIDTEEVEKVVESTFHFEGWVEDLRINPYSIYCCMYNMGENELDDFKKEIGIVSEYAYDLNQIQFMYEMCKTMHDIESKIRDEWI